MDVVHVLSADPDLADGIEEPRLAVAVDACRARALEVAGGEWEVEAVAGGEEGFGLLVLSGILCRRVGQNQRFGAELVGPGDLLRPWDTIGEWSTIPFESSWTVLEPARLALLDRAFTRRASPFPEVSVQLLRRSLLRARYLTVLAAIISQRRVETRLTMLFWHLADRFGHVRGDWVDIPLPLTHNTLADLIAARRPSVTTALSHLTARDVLYREPHGWRLRGEVPKELLEVQGAEAVPGAGYTAARA